MIQIQLPPAEPGTAFRIDVLSLGDGRAIASSTRPVKMARQANDELAALDDSRRRHKKASIRIAGMVKTAAAREKEIVRLKTELAVDRLKLTNAAIDQVMKTDLTTALESRCKYLEECLKTKSTKAAGLQQEIARLTDENRGLVGEALTYAQKISSVERALERNKERATRLEEDLKSTIASYQQQLEALKPVPTHPEPGTRILFTFRGKLVRGIVPRPGSSNWRPDVELLDHATNDAGQIVIGVSWKTVGDYEILRKP